MKENNFNQTQSGLVSKDWEVSNYIKTLKELKPILKKEFKISRIGILGSFVRNEQRKNSDIDIIVKFSEPIGLRVIDLIEFLEKKLRRKVDLVSSEGISPYIKPYMRILYI